MILNPKTISKWKKRDFARDAAIGAKATCPTTHSPAEEAMIAALRKPALLPLDDGPYALQATIPHLSMLGPAQALPMTRHQPASG